MSRSASDASATSDGDGIWMSRPWERTAGRLCSAALKVHDARAVEALDVVPCWTVPPGSDKDARLELLEGHGAGRVQPDDAGVAYAIEPVEIRLLSCCATSQGRLTGSSAAGRPAL
jgi:hypothetical protein